MSYLNRENLLALRNAIDDILAEDIKASAGKRQTTMQKLMDKHRNTYAAGTWKQRKTKRKNSAA